MALTRNEIIEKLKEVIQLALGDKANIEEYTENSNLITDLGLNSVGILYIVIAIEEFFSIEFDDVGFGDFQTVKDVIDYIYNKVNA
ncbi:MAG: acyl carrier protein [Clostridia bacterium]|nr:acyl carrier protein [Clostridia bacterium]